MRINNAEARREEFFYSAVMLNTDISYRTLCDLKDNGALKDYRDLYDKELLKRIANNEFKVKPESVHRIKNTLNNMLSIFGDRHVCIGREISKIYEEYSKTSETAPSLILTVND